MLLTYVHGITVTDMTDAHKARCGPTQSYPVLPYSRMNHCIGVGSVQSRVSKANGKVSGTALLGREVFVQHAGLLREIGTVA